VIETVGGELAKAWAAKAINARTKMRTEEKVFIGIELNQQMESGLTKRDCSQEKDAHQRATPGQNKPRVTLKNTQATGPRTERPVFRVPSPSDNFPRP
jgi:hypothetical protein